MKRHDRSACFPGGGNVALLLDALCLIFSEFITPSPYIELVHLLKKCHERGVGTGGVTFEETSALVDRGFPEDYKYQDHIEKLRFACHGFQSGKLQNILTALRTSLE